MDSKLVRNIERLMQDPSFRAWCVQKASPEESRCWDRWISENDHQKRAGEIAKMIVLEMEHSGNPLPPNKKFQVWKKIRMQLRNSEGQNFSGLSLPARRPKRSLAYTAVAVVLLLLVSFIAISYTDIGLSPDVVQTLVPETLTTSTVYGEEKIISLDSGTKIILNANSSLTYQQGWVFNNKVHVRLEGEAYFDVAKRDSTVDPVFEVGTSDGYVSVMGTRFVVATWNDRTQVVLEEGNVSINKASKNKGSRSAVLSPNEIAEFSYTSKEITIEEVNPELYTSWIKGFLVFDQTPLTEVAKRIENIFGVDVVIANPVLLTRKVSGSVESKNADLVATALSKTLQIPIMRANNKIIFGQSFFMPAFNNQSANLNEEPNE